MGFLEDVGGLLQPVSDAGQGFRDFTGIGENSSLRMSKKTAGTALTLGGAGLVVGAGAVAVPVAVAAGSPFAGVSAGVGAVSSAGGALISGLPSWLLPLGAGFIGASLLGKKTEQTTNQNQYTTQTTSNISNNSQITKNTNITGDWSTWNPIISNSPGATLSMKKGSIAGSLTGSPAQSNPLTSSPSQSAQQTAAQGAGTDFVTIAAILSVAFVAATYFKGKGK